jgi:hypothetical protein
VGRRSLAAGFGGVNCERGEAGFTEDRAGFTEDRNEDGVESSPVAMASLLTTALSAYLTEDQLLDTMTWG